jgi:hypothetical protein
MDSGQSLTADFGLKVKVKGKVVPVLNQAPCHEDVLGRVDV